MPSSRSAVMPGRAMTRWRCRKTGALTTRVASTRRSPRPSNSSGMSSTTSFSPRRAARFRKARCRWPTSGWTMASSLRSACLVAEHARAQRLAVEHAVLHHAGKRRLDRRQRRAARRLQGVDGGVGVVHRHAHLPQHPGRGRLAHADRAGQADDHHRTLNAFGSVRGRGRSALSSCGLRGRYGPAPPRPADSAGRWRSSPCRS